MVVAHVVPDPADIIRLGWYPLLQDVRFDVEGQEYLDGVLRQVRDQAPVAHRGATVPLLVDLARGAQMLVIGAHGLGGHRRLGSVGAHLAAHAPCPVAVVRDPEASPGPCAGRRGGRRVVRTLRRAHPHLEVVLDLRDDDPPRALTDAGRHSQLPSSDRVASGCPAGCCSDP